MGIGIHALQFLLHEHSYKPITGELLTIGKQAIPLSPDQITNAIQQYGIPPRQTNFEFDTINQHRESVPLISDKSLFAAFSDCTVRSADISDYEGADYVFDICGESVPRKMRGRFQFIIDGGSLDNVFDPFQMLANMTDMLAPAGRILIFAWSNSHPTAYAKVTPDWLMDYFAVNEFADCKVYPLEFPDLVREADDPIDFTVYQYDPYVENAGGVGYECSSIFSQKPMQTHCIAEKGITTTSSRAAIQKHYRGGSVEPYLTSIKRFRSSPRPIFSSPTSKSLDVPAISSYETMKPVARW